MGTPYDAKIIQEAADRLYSQANSVVLSYAMLGGLVGGGAGFGIGRDVVPAVIGAVVVAGLGFALGREKAFALKLQAQTALCQAKIEENTRVKGS